MQLIRHNDGKITTKHYSINHHKNIMNFCTQCHQFLSIREEIQQIQNSQKTPPKKRNIYLYCVNCQCKFECKNYRIELKYYRQKSKDEFVVMNQHLNAYKSKDITLPMQKKKCPKCKQTNMNKFERIYFKNNHQFELNYICSNCYYNWS